MNTKEIYLLTEILTETKNALDVCGNLPFKKSLLKLNTDIFSYIVSFMNKENNPNDFNQKQYTNSYNALIESIFLLQTDFKFQLIYFNKLNDFINSYLNTENLLQKK